jgi:hypothetical protein
MPSKEAHLAAARENQRAVDYLSEKLDQFPGWTATVAFYKALHIVEALFAVDGAGLAGHTDEHRERNRILKSVPRYQHIWRHYRELFQTSLIARYLRENQNAPDYEVFSRYMPPEKVKQLVLNHWLLQVERSAMALVGGEGFKPAASDE